MSSEGHIMNKHNERAELKPCPFCGEAHDLTVHVYGNGEDDAYVQCRECTTCGPDGGDREGAIVKWNQRAAMLEAQRPALKPLTDEQIDAAVKAWFATDIVAGRQPFSKRMRAAIEAAHGIKEQA